MKTEKDKKNRSKSNTKSSKQINNENNNYKSSK